MKNNNLITQQTLDKRHLNSLLVAIKAPIENLLKIAIK